MTRILLLFLLSVLMVHTVSAQTPSPFLQRLNENAGLTLLVQQISPEKGEAGTYTCFSIPLEFNYARSRYTSFRVKLNQGYQSYAGTGLYGLSDLIVSARHLYRKNITLLGAIIVPIGSKELTIEEITTTSAARIPFINSPLIYGNSGFGFHAGFSYGLELNERTGLAVGISYRLRTTYKPIEKSPEYDPSDELMLAAGLHNGDKSKGYTADVQLSSYSAEKLDGKKFSQGGTGIAISARGFLHNWRADALYYQRQASKLVYGGDFKAPLILNLRIGMIDLLPLQSFVPYAGLEHTGEGTLMPAATLVLLGGYFEELQINGYPLSPFVQLSYGTVGDKTSTMGFKIGSNVSFQVY